MMYKVRLSTEAQGFYAAASLPIAKKIAKCLLQLEKTPLQHPNIKPLKGKLWGYYRYRIGDYRVVYQIDEQTNQVLVDTIAHRGKVYD